MYIDSPRAPRKEYSSSGRATARGVLIGAQISKAPKGNGIGATGSKNWVWF